MSRSDGGDKSKFAKIPSLVIIFCPYEMRSSFGRDSSDGYCVAFAQSLGHVLIAYTPVGLYAGSLSRPRLTPETSVVPAYLKFGDRNFAPNGAKREARFSGATLRAHAVVSPFNLSAEFSLLLFCPAKEKRRNPCSPLCNLADFSGKLYKMNTGRSRGQKFALFKSLPP